MTAHTYATMNMTRCGSCCACSAAAASVCAEMMMDTALRAVSILIIGIILLVVPL